MRSRTGLYKVTNRDEQKRSRTEGPGISTHNMFPSSPVHRAKTSSSKPELPSPANEDETPVATSPPAPARRCAASLVQRLVFGAFLHVMTGFHGLSDAHSQFYTSNDGFMQIVRRSIDTTGFFSLGEPAFCGWRNRTDCSDILGQEGHSGARAGCSLEVDTG